MSFHYLSVSSTHVGHVRKHNEDSFLDQVDNGLWVVADGMGGHEAGDLASSMIVETLRIIKQVTVEQLDIKVIQHALHSVNKKLVQLGKENNRINGSTAVVMLANGETCEFVWAGDSRLYRLRNKELIQLTKDHSQAEIYVDLGMLSREEASQHVSANLLTRAVGTDEELKLDQGSCELEQDDRYLLCSDGLDKHVSHQQIRDTLITYPLDEVADQLIKLALDNGGTDNVTVTVIDIISR